MAERLACDALFPIGKTVANEQVPTTSETENQELFWVPQHSGRHFDKAKRYIALTEDDFALIERGLQCIREGRFAESQTILAQIKARFGWREEWNL